MAGEEESGETPPSESCTPSPTSSTVSISDPDDFIQRMEMWLPGFPALYLRIGSWLKLSRDNQVVIVARFLGTGKITWEVQEGGMRNVIQMLWSDIVAIRAFNDNGPGILKIKTSQPPRFFRKVFSLSDSFQLVSDFTRGQATLCKIHKLLFPPGVLDRFFNVLLESDARLLELSTRPFPNED